ncbi:MAG: 30S ribosomal protein S16 [Patescibacteria group bacterium]
MSVTIRLSKIGKKNSPSYRIVVCPTKSKRDGENLAILGFFNPSSTPSLFEYDKTKYLEWVKKGAMVSPAVEKLINGTYQFKKYQPKKAQEEAK